MWRVFYYGYRLYRLQTMARIRRSTKVMMVVFNTMMATTAHTGMERLTSTIGVSVGGLLLSISWIHTRNKETI